MMELMAAVAALVPQLVARNPMWCKGSSAGGRPLLETQTGLVERDTPTSTTNHRDSNIKVQTGRRTTANTTTTPPARHRDTYAPSHGHGTTLGSQDSGMQGSTVQGADAAGGFDNNDSGGGGHGALAALHGVELADISV